MSRTVLWKVLLVVVTALMAVGAASFRTLLAGLPALDHPLTAAEAPSILVSDRHGRLLYEVIDPGGNKHVPLSADEIPVACRQATIATEDSRFFRHPGFDVQAIARAAYQNLLGRRTVSGGSTLTQQLARNLYLGPAERQERSLRRKLREAWLAWQIERRYSKDQILAQYLNTTYFGHYAVGIEAAAQAYFGMHARELDLAQCALLAGLPQYPAGYNPIQNLPAAKVRQQTVLALMVGERYITQAQAEQAQNERMLFAGTPFPIAAPHFVMWVQDQLEASLGPDVLRAGGLRVTTTLDLDWQEQAERVVARRLEQLRPCAGDAAGGMCDAAANAGRRVDNAALVALDPATGAVRVMVGSPDYFDPAISGALNAALSLRQPGSAIKPITYAAAFDPERAKAAGREPWTAATLIADQRTVFVTAEGGPYVPQDYDLRTHGPVTARLALANSYNIPAVKALEAIGVEALIDQARRMGIASFGQPAGNPLAPGQGQERFGLALTLGGGEVRLLDLAAAYAIFANGGQSVPPFGIARVETSDGRTILDCEARPDQCGREARQVLDPDVAFLITDILADREARLPAFGEGNALEIGRPAAAKTGTTTDWRDNWTVGYTPELVAGVWVGNADNAPMLDVSGISGAGPIWHDFMVSVLNGAPARGFVRPDALIQLEICADSGAPPFDPIAGRGSAPAAVGVRRVPCPQRRQEWFISGTEPCAADDQHVEVALDARDDQPATPDTPPGFVYWRAYWLLPAEHREWAIERDYPQPPPSWLYPAMTGSGAAPAVALVSPDPNRVYQIDGGLPREAQQLPVTVRLSRELLRRNAPVTVQMDGHDLATIVSPDDTIWWPLERGRHVIQAVARPADDAELWSAPVTITVN